MADFLVFSLEPRGSSLTLRALLESVESINKILRDVEYGLTGDKKPRQWLITKISNPIPTMRLEPMIDEVGLVDAMAYGIRTITSEEAPHAPPNGWGELALDDLRGMKRLFGRTYQMRQVTVKKNDEPVARIADQIERQVDRVYRGGYHLLGSLEGNLEAVNLHGRAHTTLWERVSGKPVRVYLPQDLKSRAKEMLEHKVLAIGRINYFADGTPRSIVELTEIRDLVTDHRLIATYGSIPDLTGDTDTAEFLRAMRE